VETRPEEIGVNVVLFGVLGKGAETEAGSAG
jgi:hypothetical protein